MCPGGHASQKQNKKSRTIRQIGGIMNDTTKQVVKTAKKSVSAGKSAKEKAKAKKATVGNSFSTGVEIWTVGSGKRIPITTTLFDVKRGDYEMILAVAIWREEENVEDVCGWYTSSGLGFDVDSALEELHFQFFNFHDFPSPQKVVEVEG